MRRKNVAALDESNADQGNDSDNFENTIRNPYERPSTSRAAQPTARKHTSGVAKANDKTVGAQRRKMNTRQRQLKWLRETKRLQQMTRLMISKSPFCRLVREISMSYNSEITRYTATALEALQEATEMFLTQVLTDAYLLTLHRKCVTLSLTDMLLIRSLKLNF